MNASASKIVTFMTLGALSGEGGVEPAKATITLKIRKDMMPSTAPISGRPQMPIVITWIPLVPLPLKHRLQADRDRANGTEPRNRRRNRELDSADPQQVQLIKNLNDECK